MGISGINSYNHPNYYSTAKVNQTGKTEETTQSKTEPSAVSDVKKTSTSVTNADTQKYLADLQSRNSQINIMQGGKDMGRFTNSNSKTDVIIAPSILKQMASDPEAAMKYEKMLSDIPALDKWADSMIRSLTGSEVKYRQVWIDDNGNMGSFSVTGPSEETKKAQQQKAYADKIREQKEKQRELLERLQSDDKTPVEAAYMESIAKLMSVDYKA